MTQFPDRIPLRAAHAPLVLRLALAAVFASHGITRLVMDRVTPFGEVLDKWGFPFGIAWAWGVTLFEILAAALLLVNRAVKPVCLLLVVEMATGIWFVHWKHGWFVVGHGQNGMEYSFMLIAALLALISLQPGVKHEKKHGA